MTHFCDNDFPDNGQKVSSVQGSLAPDDFKIWKNSPQFFLVKFATKWAFIEVLSIKLYIDIWNLENLEV